MIPPPTVLGLTICEKVIFEEGTKNATLVSTFTKLTVEHFPSPPQKFVVFTVLTDGFGEGTIDLVVRSLETNEEIYANRLVVKFANKLSECVVPRRPLLVSIPRRLPAHFVHR